MQLQLHVWHDFYFLDYAASYDQLVLLRMISLGPCLMKQRSLVRIFPSPFPWAKTYKKKVSIIIHHLQEICVSAQSSSLCDYLIVKSQSSIDGNQSINRWLSIYFDMHQNNFESKKVNAFALFHSLIKPLNSWLILKIFCFLSDRLSLS